jgi:hypothetical protein
MSNFRSILDAVDKYAEQTGINLKENPFADKVKDCDSPSAVLLPTSGKLESVQRLSGQQSEVHRVLSPVVQVRSRLLWNSW